MIKDGWSPAQARGNGQHGSEANGAGKPLTSRMHRLTSQHYLWERREEGCATKQTRKDDSRNDDQKSEACGALQFASRLGI